ncbi:MAG TPA: hypothetical protein VG269_29460 [Tepidisphaeraceae bacterium]|nr:hypothetical protein [Tepidisphaeraceae bacterium]
MLAARGIAAEGAIVQESLSLEAKAAAPSQRISTVTLANELGRADPFSKRVAGLIADYRGGNGLAVQFAWSQEELAQTYLRVSGRVAPAGLLAVAQRMSPKFSYKDLVFSGNLMLFLHN